MSIIYGNTQVLTYTHTSTHTHTHAHTRVWGGGGEGFTNLLGVSLSSQVGDSD